MYEELLGWRQSSDVFWEATQDRNIWKRKSKGQPENITLSTKCQLQWCVAFWKTSLKTSLTWRKSREAVELNKNWKQ